jgi:hypothetical protein
MRLPLIVSGLVGAALLAIGSGFVLPLNSLVGGACDLAGIASTLVFFGLAESE